MSLDSGSKYIKYLFAAVFAFVILSAGSLSVFTGNQTTDFSVTNTVHAQEGTTYTFMQNVDLPGFGGDDGTITVSNQSFATYVNGLIQVAIGFAILLSVIMVIAGGAEWMGARSVTKKSDAKDRIGKAIGGLLLALSAVVILQTINPNLIELDPLSEVNVEGEDISTPDFDGDLINEQTDGIYHCYDSDKSYVDLNWNKVCADTESSCQDKMEIDDQSAEDAVCEAYLIYNGSRDGFGDNAQCAIFEDDRVQCFSQANDPDGSNETVDDPEASCQGSVDAYDPAKIAGCKPPSEIDLVSLDEGTVKTFQSSGTLIGDSGGFVGDELYNATGTGEATITTIAKQQAKNECENKLMDYAGKDESDGGTDVCETGPNGLFGCTIDGCETAEQVGGDNLVTQYIINGDPSESEIRNTLWNQNPTVFTNRGGESDPRDGEFCESTDDSNCTNLGGLSQAAINGLQELNQDFTSSPQCSDTDCSLTITGGTSWWFHGNNEDNPLDQVGETHHNPTGIDPDLDTGAVDFRKTEELKNYIQSNACNGAGNSYQVDNDYFLEEDDHWHVVFDDYRFGC